MTMEWLFELREMQEDLLAALKEEEELAKKRAALDPTKKELDRLAFARWLYQQGKIKGDSDEGVGMTTIAEAIEKAITELEGGG